ncbi:MAG TPA: LON peptidase substrate-binding domain-containing protein [Burkholderiaceae bacterium]|nr:LON peptidase substrate-binding domain-containing protein [Burkholderiaceae bacterium]
MSSTQTIALFPLKSVLFPDALLQLKVFEARYLDLVSRCLRENEPFGVVCLAAGREVGRHKVSFESQGVLAHIDEVDAEGANLLRVRCRGGARFEVAGTPRQQPDGLWMADVDLVPADEAVTPEPEFFATVQALQQVIASLREQQGKSPFAEPFSLDDAGWVANRWCEILPVPLAARQKLMMLPDPQARLRLVHEYLKGKGVVQ